MSDVSEKIVGSWRQLDFFSEDATSGERLTADAPPHGFLVVTADRRWIALITPVERVLPQNDAERAAAFDALVAYTGKYRVDGARITVTVDGSAQGAMIGQQRVRHCRLVDAQQMQLVSDPMSSGGRTVRNVICWRRET